MPADADIFEFGNFALSARGLMARVILPNNKAALQADIASVDFVVQDITNNALIDQGSLDPAVVMFATLQKPWKKDLDGYAFLWAVPGNYMPQGDTKVRFKLTFTIPNDHPDIQLQGKSFILVYQADVKEPLS